VGAIDVQTKAEPGRAEPDRTELNGAERVTIHIASWAEPTRTERSAADISELRGRQTKCMYFH